jgi:THAP4-like, heme-binding beta-barrel domain
VTSAEADLPAELFPISYLLGTWAGEGVGGYPGEPDYPFAQEVSFRLVPGLPVLGYVSRTWDPVSGEPLSSEVGYWRTAGTFETGLRVEVMLAHPTGMAEVYVGDVDGGKIELSNNVTVRTATAREIERSERLYGIVEGDLAYAIDIAAEGQPMRPYMSARLQKQVQKQE